jgi:hypothetical protein
MSNAVVTPANCANCDSPLGGHYCANCGQEAVLHQASTREFLHEFIGHYVALEGKLLGSLARLVFRPGLLTNEYMRGRRVRFVEPLRLYLSFSLLFFALLKFGDFQLVDTNTNTETAAPSAQVATAGAHSAPAAAAAPRSVIEPGAKGSAEREKAEDEVDEWLAGHDQESLRHKWQALSAMPAEQQKAALQSGFYRYAPYAIFCLMPVFALYLKMLYVGSGRRFGEHVLFALHTNAFAFLLFSLMLVIPVGFIRFLLWCWLLGYLPWAMRRVYHSGRAGTLLRWAVLMFFYSISSGVALGIAGALGAATAH